MDPFITLLVIENEKVNNIHLGEIIVEYNEGIISILWQDNIYSFNVNEL